MSTRGVRLRPWGSLPTGPTPSGGFADGCPTPPVPLPSSRMPEGVISIDDPRADDVRELLERHLAFARANTPPEDAHALEVDALADPSVTFFSYRAGGELLGVAALKRLDGGHAEIKSMHTAETARGRGIGRALVDHLVGAARERGHLRLSLETGAGRLRRGAGPLHERRLRGLRALRRLWAAPEQRVHDAVARRSAMRLGRPEARGRRGRYSRRPVSVATTRRSPDAVAVSVTR